MAISQRRRLRAVPRPLVAFRAIPQAITPRGAHLLWVLPKPCIVPSLYRGDILSVFRQRPPQPLVHGNHRPHRSARSLELAPGRRREPQALLSPTVILGVNDSL